jgi:hypothetical protein
MRCSEQRYCGAPSSSKVCANHIPRLVNCAEQARSSVMNVSMPSRARSATVTPETGFVFSAPCQAPAFLRRPLGLRHVSSARRLATDRLATGARGWLGTRSSLGALGADPPGLFRNALTSGPLKGRAGHTVGGQCVYSRVHTLNKPIAAPQSGSAVLGAN